MQIERQFPSNDLIKGRTGIYCTMNTMNCKIYLPGNSRCPPMRGAISIWGYHSHGEIPLNTGPSPGRWFAPISESSCFRTHPPLTGVQHCHWPSPPVVSIQVTYQSTSYFLNQKMFFMIFQMLKILPPTLPGHLGSMKQGAKFLGRFLWYCTTSSTETWLGPRGWIEYSTCLCRDWGSHLRKTDLR